MGTDHPGAVVWHVRLVPASAEPCADTRTGGEGRTQCAGRGQERQHLWGARAALS